MTALAPAVPTHCTNNFHYLLMNTDAERCPICGRKLWRRPPTKCALHAVYACSECFTLEQFFKLRFGADDSKLEEEENENDNEDD
jgi:DNA-directed RNA polymerase subunit RPC12/RpoP